MSKYFEYFPRVSYKGNVLTNITRKVDFSETIFSEASVFLPYTIEDDALPEDIAFYYYGDVKYVWIVFLSNNIIDPYHEWPLSEQKFNSYLIRKYADLSSKSGTKVLDWLQNTTITDNIIHYENVEEPGFIITKETFDLSDTIVESEWNAVRYYDYEFEQNEDRRSIVLLDERYKKQAETELRSILDNGN